MFFNDHSPPHFHAIYSEHEAIINIEGLCVSSGYLPRRALELVLEWAQLHQQELLEDWNLCKSKKQPNVIPPLK
jgi:hypothetical protein